MRTIEVTKMQGCGNDFAIVDFEEYNRSGVEMSEFAKRICDRHFGIGADGLIIPKINCEDADIGWHFYNSDGSTAQMCGNGMRCFAKYVFDKNLVNKKSFSVKTDAGIIKPEILHNGEVRVNMGKPILDYEKIPFNGEKEIDVPDKTFKITPVSMGNPHCVIFIDENPLEMAEKYGRTIETHNYFPQKTNVEFVKVLSKDEVEMCVWERGCGITLACGTGACATVVAGVLNNLTHRKVKVDLLGGSLIVDWQGNSPIYTDDIFITGKAEYVYKANFYL